MEEILLDKDGYNQFLCELDKLKKQSIFIANNGSQSYSDAVGDGWHDNFAFEESVRQNMDITSRIENMYRVKKHIKIINKEKLKENIVNIDDCVEIQFIYGNGEEEIAKIKLTGKYIPDSDEVTLNSPLGKVLYKVGSIYSYNVGNTKISFKILTKTWLC
ncbi:MAG: hypothetical protein Q4E75_01195 [bacterium]|nr:hypothetical protein [bacterium]